MVSQIAYSSSGLIPLANGSAVALSIGLFRLPAKRLAKYPNYKPAFLRNKYVRWSLATLFAGFNILSLVVSARERNNGGISRKYWPIATGGVIAAGIVYWSLFRVWGVKFKRNGPTLGELVGVHVSYHEHRQGRQGRDWVEHGDPAQEDVEYEIASRGVDCKVFRSHLPPELPFPFTAYT